MELKGITMPGYKVYEYLLVLNPHEELRKKIVGIQMEFADEFKVTTKGGANLGLVRFLNYEMMEQRIINKLRLIALGYPPFKIELKDFGSFPTHTIYIQTVSKLPIQNLVKEIRSETQRLMKLDDDNKPHFILEPHITIGRKLKPWQYEKGWLKYSNKHFTGRFIADAMVLLRRERTGEPWQILERFEFQNMPVTTRQGELFG